MTFQQFLETNATYKNSFQKYMNNAKGRTVNSEQLVSILLPSLTLKRMFNIGHFLEALGLLQEAKVFWSLLEKTFQRNTDFTAVLVSREAAKGTLLMGGWKQAYALLVQIEQLHSDYLKQSLEATKDALDHAHAKIRHKYEKKERVYIIKNEVYSEEPVFKIGKTFDLHKRLSTYNTSSLTGVCVVYERTCMDSRLVESVLHFLLEPFRSDRAREYFELDVKQIRKLVDKVVDFIDGTKWEVLTGLKEEEIVNSEEPLEVSETQVVEEFNSVITKYAFRR